MEQQSFLGAVVHCFEILSAVHDVRVWNTDNRNHETMTVLYAKELFSLLDFIPLTYSQATTMPLLSLHLFR